MSSSIDKLVQIMARLRDPKGGCPWDLKQTFKSVAPHTLEETYEVVDAIENGTMNDVKDELGDLLFQIVFHAQMAKEQNLFDLDAIAEAVTAKMIERHPHVFGDRVNVNSPNDVVQNWETDKAAKRQKEAELENKDLSVLDNITLALPAMTRTTKITQRVAHVKFDWPEISGIVDKIHEELSELELEIAAHEAKPSEALHERMNDELGDVLFIIVNLARRLKLDPEKSLRHANQKFERRFRYLEAQLKATGRSVEMATFDEKETLWIEAKKLERAGKL